MKKKKMKKNIKLQKTKKILTWAALGVTTIVTGVVVVIAYNIGFNDGHAAATDDWFSMGM